MSKLINFEVSHPTYGTIVVPSIGAESATLAAFQAWGEPEAWGREVGYCTWRKLGPAGKPRCRTCGEEYGKAGDPAGLCPFCQRVAENRAREKAVKFRPQDRRAGLRERERGGYHAGI